MTDLPKFNDRGEEWLYYVTETAVQSESDNSDLTSNYSVTYRDKNNYTVSGMTYSGGSITNTKASKKLTVSKTVAGNMGNTEDQDSFLFQIDHLFQRILLIINKTPSISLYHFRIPGATLFYISQRKIPRRSRAKNLYKQCFKIIHPVKCNICIFLHPTQFLMHPEASGV